MMSKWDVSRFLLFFNWLLFWPTYTRQQSSDHDHVIRSFIYLLLNRYVHLISRQHYKFKWMLFLLKTNDSRLANLPCTYFHNKKTELIKPKHFWSDEGRKKQYIIEFKYVNMSKLPYMNVAGFHREFSSI